MKTVRSSRFALAIVAVALLMSAGVCALPTDPYERWQLMRGTILQNTKWIYERIHFDPTPIDVAVIGTSKTLFGVSAPILMQTLAKNGLKVHAVNMAMVAPGRATDYAVVKELLANKHPRLIIMGIEHVPSRYAHPAFKAVAPTSLILSPGYLTNLNYFPTLAYLPYRQLRLAWDEVVPGADGMSSHFDPSRYLGESYDTTVDLQVSGRTVWHAFRIEPPAALNQGSVEQKIHEQKSPLGLGIVQYGDEHYYVTKIAQLCRAHGVKLVFLYQTFYGGAAEPADLAFYRRLGPVWNGSFVTQHPEWWGDPVHLGHVGAVQFTTWLAGDTYTELSGASSGPPDTGDRNVTS